MSDPRFPGHTLTPNQAGCTSCGNVFASTESFDNHRGVRVRPRGEEAQDKSVCTPDGVLRQQGYRKSGGVWYSVADWALHERMRKIKEVRT